MSIDKETITEWKNTEKKMMDDAFQALLHEVTKSKADQYIETHGPKRSKFELFLLKTAKKLGGYGDAEKEAFDKKYLEQSWCAADRYDLALKLAEGDEAETKRITDIKKWMDGFYTVGMVIGKEKNSVALEFLQDALAAHQSTTNEYDFVIQFLVNAGFNKEKGFDNLPDLCADGQAPVNIHVEETFTQFLSRFKQEYSLNSDEEVSRFLEQG